MSAPYLLGDVRDRVSAVIPDVRKMLDELLRIPTTAAVPERAPEVQRSAEALSAMFREVGVEAEVVSVPGGRPAVIGRIPAPAGRPTVLLYSHHDVQPEGRLSGWSHPPYEPVERDGRLYARGAADNKSGIAVHLGSLLALRDRLGVGITVLIEGEEEIGSPQLVPFLEEHGDRLAADVLIITDGTNWATGVPSLTTSLRGLVVVDATVKMLAAPVHSGMNGGPVVDAVIALSHLLASFHNTDGSLAVEGLISGATDPLGLTADDFRRQAGVLPGVLVNEAAAMTSQMWRGSALAVVGVDAPSIAGAANVLVPNASARLSLRVAPGQDCDSALAALEAHLAKHLPFGAHLESRVVSRTESFLLESDTAGYRAAEAALSEAWDGARVVAMGGGGGIPAVAKLAKALPDAQIIITGVCDQDSSVHGFNESVDLRELERAILAEVLLLEALGSR